MILAIPGAIAASSELADRIELRQKLQRLIDLSREQWQQHRVRIWFKRADQATPKPLDQAEPDDLMED